MTTLETGNRFSCLQDFCEGFDIVDDEHNTESEANLICLSSSVSMGSDRVSFIQTNIERRPVVKISNQHNRCLTMFFDTGSPRNIMDVSTYL